MNRIFSFFAVVFLGLGLVVADAEAKRLGSGKSLGMQRYDYSKQAPSAPQRQAVSPQRSAAPAGASGASRWLGPLAGLAAGGLLAAMLFGDGFEGLQILDLLLFAGIAFAIFAFMRRRAGASQVRPAMAGAYSREAAAPAFETPEIGSGVGSAPAPGAAGLPAWFDEEGFLRGAKGHFIRLQAAWDSGDMKDLREYTTPELFAELTLERQGLGEGNFTEVVRVEAELVGYGEEGGFAVASVRFTGEIREEEGGAPQPFAELWHVRRDLGQDGADWFVAGIQQDERLI